MKNKLILFMSCLWLLNLSFVHGAKFHFRIVYNDPEELNRSNYSDKVLFYFDDDIPLIISPQSMNDPNANPPGMILVRTQFNQNEAMVVGLSTWFGIDAYQIFMVKHVRNRTVLIDSLTVMLDHANEWILFSDPFTFSIVKNPHAQFSPDDTFIQTKNDKIKYSRYETLDWRPLNAVSKDCVIIGGFGLAERHFIFRPGYQVLKVSFLNGSFHVDHV